MIDQYLLEYTGTTVAQLELFLACLGVPKIKSITIYLCIIPVTNSLFPPPM